MLRRFAAKNDYLYVYDKQEQRSFYTNIKNIASENHFYHFHDQNENKTIEKWLGDIENAAIGVLNSKVSLETGIKMLTLSDYEILAKFIAIQITRTKNKKIDYLESMSKFLNILTEKNNETDFYLTDNDKQKSFISTVTDSDLYVPFLLKKKWLYQYSDQNLYISDNPITFQNNLLEHRPYRSNLGINVTGIEITFPISSNSVIVLFCEQTFNEIERMYLRNPEETDRISNYQIRNTVNSTKRKIPMKLDKANVLNNNSGQVLYAERFIFSANNDFELVKDMIKDNGIQKGPRTKVG